LQQVKLAKFYKLSKLKTSQLIMRSCCHFEQSEKSLESSYIGKELLPTNSMQKWNKVSA